MLTLIFHLSCMLHTGWWDKWNCCALCTSSLQEDKKEKFL